VRVGWKPLISDNVSEVEVDGKCLGPGHFTALGPGLGFWSHNLRKQFEVGGSMNDVSFEQGEWSRQGGNTFLCMLLVTTSPVLVTDDLWKGVNPWI